MKTSLVSSYATANATRASVLKLQAELARANKEATTGQIADLGLGLGGKVGLSVSLRVEQTRLETIQGTNTVVASRLDTTQQALASLLDSAQNLLGSLLAAQQSSTSAELLKTQAADNLAQLTSVLNSSFNGEYLFGGINSDVKPVADYFASPAAANKQAVDAAFVAAFGFSQTDPAAAGIDPAAMQGFLDGAFASLFDEAGWTTDWSNAASQPLRSRISPTQLIDASVHANEQALRELAQAYTMVLDAGVGTLGESAARTVLTSATALLGQAMGHLTQLQSTIGVAQERVANASTQMSAQVDILAKLQADLEGVDPYEAATRVNTLTTQLETSYALTARMHQLSLLNYL